MEKGRERLLKKTEEQLNSVSNLFSILSHPKRLKIVWLLRKNKFLNVHEIQEKLKISQSNVSQHLSLLKQNKLITEERRGKEVYYRLAESKKISKVLSSAVHFISYQIAANNELLSGAEFITLWM